MAYGTRFSEEELEDLATRYGVDSPEPTGSAVIETERSERTAVLSVRLPIAVVAMLKSMAEDEGIGATVLARDFIIAGLTERGGLTDVSVSVVDLMSFALAKGRRNPASRDEPPTSGATVAELVPTKRVRASSVAATPGKPATKATPAKLGAKTVAERVDVAGTVAAEAAEGKAARQVSSSRPREKASPGTRERSSPATARRASASTARKQAK